MLVPNNWQSTRLFEYANVARFAYNWALAREMESLEQGNGFISELDLRKEFNKLKQSEGYTWIKSVADMVPKQAIKDLVQAYSRYFKERKKPGYVPYSKKKVAHYNHIGKSLTIYDSVGHPKFKSKRDTTRYSFYQRIDRLIITDRSVRITGLVDSKKANRQTKNYIKLAERGRIPCDVKFYNPRITYDGLNWWFSVSYDTIEPSTKYIPQTDGIGVDLGIKDTCTCSDGTIYSNINKTKKIRQLEKRKKRKQRSVSRKYEINKKGESYCKTNNIKKSEKEILKLDRRLTNIRQNYCSQITSNIVNRKPKFIVIEDLSVSGMMRNQYLSKAIQDQKLSELRRQFEYKSQLAQVPLIVADRWFPSSKTCNHCGTIKKDLRLSDRVYKCSECGYVEDRDFNAAKNLRDYGSKFLDNVN